MISLGSNQTKHGQIRRKTGSTRCCLIYGWEINIKWNQNIINVFICTRGLWGCLPSELELYMQISNETKSSRLQRHPTSPHPASFTIREYPWRTHASGVAHTLNMTTNGRFVYGHNLKPSLGSRCWETLLEQHTFFFFFIPFYFQLFIISLA